MPVPCRWNSQLQTNDQSRLLLITNDPTCDMDYNKGTKKMLVGKQGAVMGRVTSLITQGQHSITGHILVKYYMDLKYAIRLIWKKIECNQSAALK